MESETEKLSCYSVVLHIWVNFSGGDDQRLEMSGRCAVVFCYKTITRNARTSKLS